MLVLTRRIGEEIVIDGAIRVKVLAIKGTQIRLGVIAPLDVAVDREEIFERRRQETGGVPARDDRKLSAAGAA